MVYKGLKDHPDCRDPRETRGTPLLDLGDQEDFLVVKEKKETKVIEVREDLRAYKEGRAAQDQRYTLILDMKLLP